MKFAQELDQEAVPEWKAKYLNYRLAKKKLKALTRTVRDFNRTPNTPSFRNPFQAPADNAAIFQAWRRHADLEAELRDELPPETPDPNANLRRQRSKSTSSKKDAAAAAAAEAAILAERSPLMLGSSSSRRDLPPMTRYGSIIGSPPNKPVDDQDVADERPPSLRLPDPAMKTTSASSKPKKSVRIGNERRGQSAYEAGMTKAPMGKTRHLSIFDRFKSLPAATPTPTGSFQDYSLDAYKQVDNAYNEFFAFLDGELEKIETFYKEKEDESTVRLNILREQLHVLRDRRIEDLIKSRQDANKSNRQSAATGILGESDSDEDKSRNRASWLQSFDRAWSVAKNGKIGRKSVAMETETTPVAFRAQDRAPDHQDYVRRPREDKVPYRTAKRKLKLAMQEYYRGLELLKSYAMLNRTAFRKINKKYDKNLNVRPTGRYMAEKVNKAHFVNSNVLDDHLQAVEDLYARYFEAGNRKIAASKLRKAAKIRDYHGGAMFRNGVWLTAGFIFGIQGLVNAIELLHSKDSTLATNTSYLLQIYAGYMFMLLLMLLFGLACRFWTVSKVNYVFIFEFEPRDQLDWRQILELPCLFTAFLGFFVWINFAQYGNDDMYIYYPTVLVVLTLAFIFCPLPVLYQRARSWFLIACSRLLFSGLFPVEFRDFFLGDMFCSMAYSMGNIELFFCLYAQHWDNPPLCNSSHSRLFGFFTTLPGIWRALQCIRRYADTRNAFPHLANCGKYACTILYYVSLSLYRIDKNGKFRALFIFWALINAIYTSIWDIVMDWSLLDPTAPKPFLRQTLAYRQTWIYYCAMVIDPIIRFNWIFYAIFTSDVQHSTIVSFVVGLSEILRRGMWIIFRVENEHCTNVGRFRASRDIPLPFEIRGQAPTPAIVESGGMGSAPEAVIATPQISSTSPHLPTITTGSDRSKRSPGMRLRKAAEQSPLIRGLSRVGSVMHLAHAQDFERRRRPEAAASLLVDSDSSDDEGHHVHPQPHNIEDLVEQNRGSDQE